MKRIDVLIVGAGPTGLALALWLTEQGVSVRIIDRSAGPGETSRAMAVQARTLELYRQLDIAEAVVAAGHRNPSINLWVHGKKRGQLAFGAAGADLTPYPYLLVYPQDRHERLLIDRLIQRGVSVERQTEFLSLEDKGEHVVATLRNRDGRDEMCEALYVAGCDGAHSPVRHQIGSEFPGGTYRKTFYVADVQVSGANADGGVHMALESTDFVALLAYDDAGASRLIGVVEDASGDLATKLTFEDVGRDAIASLGLTVEKVNWFSTYRVHHRVTDKYRRGRAFLLGDAAHVHSPAGGQGMNTGIGDAINLAWKLAAVIHGQAPDSLLDSYEVERRAFACKLVDTTDRLFSFVTADGDFANFVRTRIAPLFAPLVYRIDPVRELIFRILSQTMISYRDCDLNEGRAGRLAGGDRLPWLKGADSDNFATLPAIGWQVHVYGSADRALARWCEAHRIALHTFAFSKAAKEAGFVQDAIYLLRPDSYIAFIDSTASVSALDDYFVHRGIKHIEDDLPSSSSSARGGWDDVPAAALGPGTLREV